MAMDNAFVSFEVLFSRGNDWTKRESRSEGGGEIYREGEKHREEE